MKMKDKLIAEKTAKELLADYPDLEMSLEEFSSDLKKTTNNVSIRLSGEEAARLIYVAHISNMPKARVVKECLADGIKMLLAKKISGLQRAYGKFSSRETGAPANSADSQTASLIGLAAVSKGGTPAPAKRGR